MRLREYFSNNEPENTENESLVKNKSSFYPPRNRDKTLDTVIDYLHNHEFNTVAGKNKSNLTKDQWNSILKLQNNKDIIIKEADKGGSVVIMNTTHYCKMIFDNLNDKKTYKEVANKCDKKVMTRIADFTKKYKDVLTKKEASYLTNFNFKTSNFYGLPKIHKSKLISEAIGVQNDEYIEVLEPIDLKVRPIVAGPMCPTRPLSALIDILLKPFVTHINSYIRENLDFLKKCSRVNNENTILVTFDVTSLYTNIPHDYGLQAIAYWIELYPDSLNLRFSKDFVLEGIKIILENNNCFFNNKYYNQIKGTAMGTIFAPTYATLTIGYFEIKFDQICELKWGKDTRDFIYKNWSRFLEDCETPLDKTKVKPEELLETLNSIHRNIQFTMEYSDVAIPFLDILIKRDKTKVWMDLYHKPTDTQRCLPFSSSHPNHCKRNIPFTLARRIFTIVENQQQKLKHIHELKSNLKKYEYPETLIENGIQKALGIPQH